MHPEIELAKKNMTENLLKDSDRLSEEVFHFLEDYFDRDDLIVKPNDLEKILISDVVSKVIHDPKIKELMASIQNRELFLRSLP